MLQKILILDKELSMCQRFSSFLRGNGYVTASTSCNKEALQLLKASKFDLILCDSELRNTYPVDFLLKIKSIQPAIPIISMSDSHNVQTAVELMKSGAFYFMLKPINPERLLDIVKEAIAKSTLAPQKALVKQNLSENKKSNAKAKKSGNLVTPADTTSMGNQAYPYIKGVSKIAKKLYKSIELVAPTAFTVIIQGETGTGKESVARMIHENSQRSKGPFVAVDCGSLSKELAASELFGHEKGAFTGALQNREGAFKLASGGTLFLDEIGNLSYDVQLLLLRSIQERVIRKVGSVTEKPVDVRLIVASNEDLYACVGNRAFREDLYHRLNEFTLIVPPLRERKADLILFIESFVEHASARLDKEIKMPDEEAMKFLKQYPWPGNIRELLNTVKKACLMTAPGNCITEQSLPYEVRSPLENKEDHLILEQANALMQHFHNNETGAADESIVRDRKSVMSEPATQDASLKDIASYAEFNKILATLKSVQYNKSKAADLLNINRKTLYNKLKKINI